jgi:hypothetical protein
MCGGFWLTGYLWLTQVHAQEQRTAADAAAQQAAAQQVIPADISSLATLELPESELPPGMSTLNLTKITPLLPLLSGLNATVIASWMPVVERTPPEALALAVPAVNALNASTLEALLAALPYLNWETVVAVLPALNALPASTLTAYINLLQDVSPPQAAANITVYHCSSHGAAQQQVRLHVPVVVRCVRLLACSGNAASRTANCTAKSGSNKLLTTSC